MGTANDFARRRASRALRPASDSLALTTEAASPCVNSGPIRVSIAVSVENRQPRMAVHGSASGSGMRPDLCL